VKNFKKNIIFTMFMFDGYINGIMAASGESDIIKIYIYSILFIIIGIPFYLYFFHRMEKKFLRGWVCKD